MDFLLSNIGNNRVNLSVPDPFDPIVSSTNCNMEDLLQLFNIIKKTRYCSNIKLPTRSNKEVTSKLKTPDSTSISQLPNDCQVPVLHSSSSEHLNSFIQCVMHSYPENHDKFTSHFEENFDYLMKQTGLIKKRQIKFTDFYGKLDNNNIDDQMLMIIAEFVKVSLVYIDLSEKTRCEYINPRFSKVMLICKQNCKQISMFTYDILVICKLDEVVQKRILSVYNTVNLNAAKCIDLKGLAKMFGLSTYDKHTKSTMSKQLLYDIVSRSMKTKN